MNDAGGWLFHLGVFPRELAGSVADMMKQVAVAMENGEYDFDGTSEKKVTYVSLGSADILAKSIKKCFLGE